MNSEVIDLSKAKARQELAPVSETVAVIEMLERATRDPSVDVVKMRELFAIRKEILADAARKSFVRAFNECQKKMRPISADATNPQTRSKYATYAKLNAALRPLYSEHGFGISFDEGTATKPDHVMVLAYLSHSDGHERTYHCEMPADGKGAKGGDVMTKTHAVGAGKSYGKRYLLKDIWDIAVGEEDTDGNQPSETITEKQAADLLALITEKGGNLSKLLKYFKIDRLGQIHAKNYDWCVSEVKRLASVAADARPAK